MAERMTSVGLRSHRPDQGLADWGRRTRPEMIEALRAKARADLQTAQEILAADDEDFVVMTYRGAQVMRDMEEVR